MVDDDGRVLVALLVAGLVDAGPPRPVEARGAPLRPGLVAGPPADAAHAVPPRSRDARVGGHAAPRRQARDPVPEVARVPGPVPRPRHAPGAHAALGARRPGGPVPREALGPRQARGPPPPGRLVVAALAPPAAGRAPRLPPHARPRRHDDRVALDRRPPATVLASARTYRRAFAMRPPPVAPDAFGEVESYGRGAPSGPLRGRSCQSYLLPTRELVKAVGGHPHKLPKSLFS